MSNISLYFMYLLKKLICDTIFTLTAYLQAISTIFLIKQKSQPGLQKTQVDLSLLN